MSDTSHSFVVLKTDPSPTLLSRRNLKELSLDIVSPTDQQQTTNNLETNLSSLTDDASLRYSLDTTDINLLDQHERDLKVDDKDTTEKENESHNNLTTTASPQQKKDSRASSLSSTTSTVTISSQKNVEHPYKVGSRVWVLWKEEELKATIKRFNRNGRPVVKWDGTTTKTTMDISDIKRFITEDGDEDETVSQTALTEVLVINDDEASPKLTDEENYTFEEKSDQGDNLNKPTSEEQVLITQSEDDKSTKCAEDTTPPTDNEDIIDNTKQSEEDEIPNDDAPSALVIIEDLEQHLDDYLKSVDKAQEVVVAWNKRKAEIKKELENGWGITDAAAALVEPE